MSHLFLSFFFCVCASKSRPKIDIKLVPLFAKKKSKARPKVVKNLSSIYERCVSHYGAVINVVSMTGGRGSSTMLTFADRDRLYRKKGWKKTKKWALKKRPFRKKMGAPKKKEKNGGVMGANKKSENHPSSPTKLQTKGQIKCKKRSTSPFKKNGRTKKKWAEKWAWKKTPIFVRAFSAKKKKWFPHFMEIKFLAPFFLYNLYREGGQTKLLSLHFFF